MIFLKFISNYISIEEIKIFLNFLKRNKIISAPTIILFILIISCLYCIVANTYFDNARFNNEKFLSNLEKKIDNSLLECGDKTAISVAVVSIKNIDDSWDARYQIVKACDNIVDGCLINLKDSKSIYRDTYQVDLNTYKGLSKWSQEGSFPENFHLRADGKQNLEPVFLFPSIRSALELSDWGKLGILEDLWITSISNPKNDVIYVISMTQAETPRKKNCFQHGKLIEIRKLILDNQ